MFSSLNVECGGIHTDPKHQRISHSSKKSSLRLREKFGPTAVQRPKSAFFDPETSPNTLRKSYGLYDLVEPSEHSRQNDDSYEHKLSLNTRRKSCHLPHRVSLSLQASSQNDSKIREISNVHRQKALGMSKRFGCGEEKIKRSLDTSKNKKMAKTFRIDIPSIKGVYISKESTF